MTCFFIHAWLSIALANEVEEFIQFLIAFSMEGNFCNISVLLLLTSSSSVKRYNQCLGVFVAQNN